MPLRGARDSNPARFLSEKIIVFKFAEGNLLIDSEITQAQNPNKGFLHTHTDIDFFFTNSFKALDYQNL